VALLNKRQLMVALPIWACMGLFLWFVPIHNLLNMPPDVLSDREFFLFTNFDNHTVVVYPILTEYAYSKHGFYDYYKKTCDQSCLTVTISRNGSNYVKLKTDVGSIYWIHPQEETSNTGFVILSKLNYHFITDIDIDKNPKILDSYSKIILLHNEYVTSKEYQALSQKSHVLYLYANAVYAQVDLNYTSHTMKLVKGHTYQGISNAFNSGTHSQGEHSLNCKNALWYKLSNGLEYSCYPELELLTDKQLLENIREFPITTGFNTTTS
jgi:hypothetical protein